MADGRVSILGRKLRMTQVFDDQGRRIPVTVIQAGPCPVLQVKTDKKDGYAAVQIGFGQGRKRVPKPLAGHLKVSGMSSPRWIREVPCPGGGIRAGEEITLDAFDGVAKVDVSGVSKGRGFAGTIKRWGLSQGPVTHGSKNVRRSGSTGQGTDPARVFKGRKMAGQMGRANVTVKNLSVVKLDAENHLLFVQGAIPGPSGGVLLIRASGGVQGA